MIGSKVPAIAKRNVVKPRGRGVIVDYRLYPLTPQTSLDRARGGSVGGDVGNLAGNAVMNATFWCG